MKILQQIYALIRYILLAIAFFSVMISALFVITPISSWSSTFLSKKLSERLNATLSISKIRVYTPFYIELQGIELQTADKAHFQCSSIQIAPSYIGILWNNCTLFYLGASDIQIKKAPLSSHSVPVDPIRPLSLYTTVQKKSLSPLLTPYIHTLHTLLDRLFSTTFNTISLWKANCSLDSITDQKVEILCSAKNVFLSSVKRTIQGNFRVKPLNKELRKQLHHISWKASIQKKQFRTAHEDKKDYLVAKLSGKVEAASFRANPFFENFDYEKTNRKTIQFYGSLRERKKSANLFGKWSFTLFDSIDHLISSSYIASQARSHGTIEIEQTGSCTLQITALHGNVNCFSQEYENMDDDHAIAPMILALLHAKKSPFSTASFSINEGTIQLHMLPSFNGDEQPKGDKKGEELFHSKQRNKKRLHFSSPWRVEYTLPSIRCTSSNAFQKELYKREYSSIGEISLITKKELNQPHTHQLVLYSNSKEKNSNSSIATLNASFDWSDIMPTNGRISLLSPLLSVESTLYSNGEQKEKSASFLSSITIPSLQPIQFFSTNPIDGSLSLLTSWTAASPSSSIPLTWEIDLFLCSGSKIRYGHSIQVETAAFSLSADKQKKVLVGNYILKNGLFGEKHRVELAKGAVQYNMRKEKLLIRRGIQKGTTQIIPYAFQYKGYIEKQNRYATYDSNINVPHLVGMITSNGKVGAEPFSFHASTSLPILHKNSSFEIAPLSHADLHISGSIGDQGSFSGLAALYDFKGESLFLHTKFASIPSSFITDLMRFPHAKGEASGHIQMETYQKKFSLKYGFSGNFNWLDRSSSNEPLHISSTGEVSQSHIISRTHLRDVSSDEYEPMELFLKIPIKTTVSHFPFVAISHTTPLYGTIQGSCSLQTAISPWLEEDEWAEGRVTIHSKIRGSLQDHKVIGEISLYNGKIDLLSLGSSLSDISIHGTLYGKDIYIDDLRATDAKKGLFFGTGSLLLPIDGKRDFSWKVHAQSSDFEIINLEYAKSVVSGKVELLGTSNTLVVTGSISSNSTIIDIGKKIAIPVPELDIVYVNHDEIEKKEEKGNGDEEFSVLLDLKVVTANPIEIKGRGLSSYWKGAIQLTGSGSKPILYGGLSTTHGNFLFAGKDFAISYGNVSFSGDPLRDSRLGISAISELSKVSARVIVRGTIEFPKISLESNPMRTEKEILSLILFNKELGDISPLESLQLASTALTLDQTAAPLQFFDSLKRKIGIDTFDFSSSRNGANNDICVRIGKYISQGVTVNISKDFRSDANRIGIELEIAKNISAEAEIGDDAQGVISIKWKKDF